MYTITIENTFSAEHGLVFADGTVEPSHSHNWVVRLAVSTQQLDENGLAIDFQDLNAKLKQVIAPLSGTKLEESGCFKGQNASAETVAKDIYDKIEQLLPACVSIVYTEVMEEKNCWAKYCK